MESPGQTGGRLLAALAELATQEAAAVQAGDFAVLPGLQARAAAVGEKLSSLAGDPSVAALRPQVADLVERRGQTQRELAQRLACVRQELDRLGTVRQRVTRLAPAYTVRGAGAAPRFTAAA